MTTTHRPTAPAFLPDRVARVVAALEDRAAGDDDRIPGVTRALDRWERNGDGALDAITAVSSQAALPVSREVGGLLYSLVRAGRARTIVEYGTSFGMSTLYLAAAARETGGRVVGTEISETKIDEAAANLADAGLRSHVDLRRGDARTTLRTLSGPVDLVLLDGWVPLYLEVLTILEPLLAPGSVLVCDTVRADTGALDGFYDHVDGQPDRYVRTRLPLDDGVELIVVR